MSKSKVTLARKLRHLKKLELKRADPKTGPKQQFVGLTGPGNPSNMLEYIGSAIKLKKEGRCASKETVV